MVLIKCMTIPDDSNVKRTRSVMKNKIVIIDSGIDRSYVNKYNIQIVDGINLCSEGEKDNIYDSLGHGTGVTSIINSMNTDKSYVIIKIYDTQLRQNEETLLNALRYIIESKIEYSIIHMSVGVDYFSKTMFELCNEIYENKNIIVSAFDNAGCISYPAAFECVIGVEANELCTKRSDFICNPDEIVSVYAKGGFHRVLWLDGKSAIKQGNSMSAAYVTGFLAKSQLQLYEKEEAIEILKNNTTFSGNTIIYEGQYFNNDYCITDNEIKSIKNASIFPYSKETSALIRYSNLLHFNIVGIYTSKYMGNIGRIVNNVSNTKSYIIQNISDINFQNIDTMILGHLNQFEKFDQNLKKHILELCLENNINVYCFDSDRLDSYYERFCKKKLFLRCPVVNRKYIGKRGKLYKTMTPIVSVFGTSSKQGKFSLQVEIKSIMENKGYEVGFLSTEPMGIFWGANKLLPFGYEGIKNISDFEFIDLANTLIHDIDLLEKDIIITGSQSSTIPRSLNHIGYMAVKQTQYMLGIQPDGVLLVINYNDSFDYIGRTISVLESLIQTRVIALVVYPLGYKTGWLKQNNKQAEVPLEKLTEYQNFIYEKFHIPVYIHGIEKEEIVQNIIDYFSA